MLLELNRTEDDNFSVMLPWRRFFVQTPSSRLEWIPLFQTFYLKRRVEVAQKPKRKVVLVADDDMFVRDAIRERLHDRDLDTLEAADEAEALKVVKSRGADIDVALLDIRMPSTAKKDNSDSEIGRRSGLRIARAIRERNPAIRIIGMSFWADQEIHDWFTKYGHGFLDKSLLLTPSSTMPIDLLEQAAKRRIRRKSPQCFVVHGHDTQPLYELVSFIQNTLGWKAPRILRDLPSQGKTIIEKFEDAAQSIDIVFVLLTPDDKGAPRSAPDLVKRRARQNVIFELGYFFAKLQRTGGRIILLHKGTVELPSDISGIAYVDIRQGIEAAGEALRRELSAWL